MVFLVGLAAAQTANENREAADQTSKNPITPNPKP